MKPNNDLLKTIKMSDRIIDAETQQAEFEQEERRINEAEARDQDHEGSELESGIYSDLGGFDQYA